MLKKIILIIIVTVLLTSCSKNSDLLSDNSDISQDVSSQSISSQSVSSQNVSSISDEVKLKINIDNEIKKPNQEINANETRYTWTLGKRKTIENALPDITSFEYPYFYYTIMHASDKENDKKGSLDIGRYSIESNIKEDIGSLDFQAQSDVDEANCIIDNRYLITSYCSSNEDGFLVMNIAVFDMEMKTKDIVYSGYSGNVFSYLRQVSENEIVLFYYEQKDTKVRNLTQKIIRYNITTKETNAILEGVPMNWEGETSTRDIWAMDFYDEKIYLLEHQFIDGKMKTFLKTIDKDGLALSEIEIKSLSHYNQKEQTASNLVVKGDYIFINYFTALSQPPSAILKWDGKQYILLDSGNVYHKNLLTPNPVDNRYLYFTTNSDYNKIDSDLFIFDLESETVRTVKMDVETILSIDCDKSGNVLIGNNNGYVSDKLYLFKMDDIQ